MQSESGPRLPSQFLLLPSPVPNNAEFTRTQGMELTDLFDLSAPDGRPTPILHPLAAPVRAIVMPVADPAIASRLYAAAKRHLVPALTEAGLWLQNMELYHSTIYHASAHVDPIEATAEEVDEEAAAVLAVARSTCPLRVALERIVATPGGGVLACWQVESGGAEPAALRADLTARLPRASRLQVVSDAAILHTTIARAVREPEDPHALQQAVHAMTKELCGVRATLDVLWFVEEREKLALALDGRFSRRRLPLRCAASGGDTG
jgi:hypothetical protein